MPFISGDEVIFAVLDIVLMIVFAGLTSLIFHLYILDLALQAFKEKVVDASR